MLGKEVIERAASVSVSEARRQRFISKCLSKHAANAVKTLACSSACDMPKKTWSAFPIADGLRIDEFYLYNNTKGAFSQMVHGIPANRIKRLYLLNVSNSIAADSAVLTISSAPATRQLSHLQLDGAITSARVDKLFSRLTELQHADIKVLGGETDAKPWSPTAARSLTSFIIAGERMLVLDVRGLSHTTQLQQLALKCCSLRQSSAFASFIMLQKLSILGCADADTALPHISKIPLLTSLDVDWAINATAWELLASLQKLTDLNLFSLNIRRNSTPSSTLTSLTSSKGLFTAKNEAADLQDVLPCLQQLTTATYSHTTATDGASWMMIGACAGHKHLSSLSLTVDKVHCGWKDGRLVDIPNLASFSYHGGYNNDPNDVLLEAAQCDSLHELRLCLSRYSTPADPKYGWAGLSAVMAGPCRSTLRTVVLEAFQCPLPLDVALLLLSLPVLEQATVTVDWDVSNAEQSGALSKLARKEYTSEYTSGLTEQEEAQQQLLQVECGSTVRRQLLEKIQKAGLVLGTAEPLLCDEQLCRVQVGLVGVEYVELVVMVGRVRAKFILVGRLSAMPSNNYMDMLVSLDCLDSDTDSEYSSL